MIRVIQRRLIIPRGDTSLFEIPQLVQTEPGDVAVLSIFDPLYKTVVCQKEVVATVNENKTLVFSFVRADTINIEPSDRYLWDIKVYKNPTREDGIIINGSQIDSYYAAFSLPTCVIKEAP